MKLKKNIAAMDAYAPGRTVPGAVKLSSNENPLGPSPKAVQAIRDALNSIHRYPEGTVKIRNVLASFWKTDPECILAANGSDEVFSLLCAAWTGPGDHALGALETFSQYRYAVRLFGADMENVPLEDGRYPLETLADKVRSQTKIIFICNPNNPTGTCRTDREIRDFLDRIPPRVIVVLDEAYAEFADAPDFPDSRALLDAYPNLVVTRTFSKLYGLAGLRVGYAVGGARLISDTARAAMPFNVNNPAQSAVAAALEDLEHQQKTLELVRSGKEFFRRYFSERQIFYYPTQANFICFRLNQKIGSVWDRIASGGIALRDLNSFGLPYMARYTFGSHQDNQLLADLLDQVISE